MIFDSPGQEQQRDPRLERLVSISGNLGGSKIQEQVTDIDSSDLDHCHVIRHAWFSERRPLEQQLVNFRVIPNSRGHIALVIKL